MSTELVKVIDASEIESKNVEVGEWGLEFKGQLTPQEWYETALAIQKFDGKLQWYLGDLAVYAESPDYGFDAKNKEGRSKYDDLIEATGYSRKFFSDVGRVARRFTETFRERVASRDATNTLSFSHFRAVAPLEDNFAEYWLIRASENGWGQKKLQEEINREYYEISEKEEAPIGYLSFKELLKSTFSGWLPNIADRKYTKKEFLVEVIDTLQSELAKEL